MVARLPSVDAQPYEAVVIFAIVVSYANMHTTLLPQNACIAIGSCSESMVSQAREGQSWSTDPCRDVRVRVHTTQRMSTKLDQTGACEMLASWQLSLSPNKTGGCGTSVNLGLLISPSPGLGGAAFWR